MTHFKIRENHVPSPGDRRGRDRYYSTHMDKVQEPKGVPGWCYILGGILYMVFVVLAASLIYKA